MYGLKDLLPKDKSAAIADLGCGPGSLLFNLKHRGYTNLFGVDVSPKTAHIARQAVETVVHGNVFDFLSQHQDSFDLILAFDLIEHFTKDELFVFLDMCYQSLREGGRLVIQTVNAHSPVGLSRRYTDLTHEICVSPGCLRNILALAGFEDYEARERGPMPYNAVNTVRYLLWRTIRLVFRAYDLIEDAGTTYPVYTRDFVATAVKR